MGMLVKTLVAGMALAIFLFIAYLPFHYTEQAVRQASYPDSHHLSWLFGLSMIIWAPLALIIAVFVALGFLCIFWPRRKVTIGEIAVKRADRDKH